MPAAAVLRQGAMPFSWARLQVRELEDRVRATRRATICALNQMLDLKDLNTGVHGTRLAEWAVRIGQDLGLDEGGLEDIEVAALLHDAGKVGVPDAILRKPGPLDPEEWRVMRMHPEFSWAGFDQGDEVGGRGTARIEHGILKGELFVHQGDNATFAARRED